LYAKDRSATKHNLKEIFGGTKLKNCLGAHAVYYGTRNFLR